jgi:hypothetical protein
MFVPKFWNYERSAFPAMPFFSMNVGLFPRPVFSNSANYEQRLISMFCIAPATVGICIVLSGFHLPVPVAAAS